MDKDRTYIYIHIYQERGVSMYMCIHKVRGTSTRACTKFKDSSVQNLRFICAKFKDACARANIALFLKFARNHNNHAQREI